MEHMVQPLVLSRSLHGDDVLGVGHHADGGLIPPRAGAQGAEPLPLGQVLTDGAVGDGAFGVADGIGEGFRLPVRQVQDIKRQALGGFGADAGELGELLRQRFQGRRQILHPYASRRAWMAAARSSWP